MVEASGRVDALAAELKVLFGLLEVLPSATLADEALRLASRSCRSTTGPCRTTTRPPSRERTSIEHGETGSRSRGRADAAESSGGPRPTPSCSRSSATSSPRCWSRSTSPTVRRCLGAHLPRRGGPSSTPCPPSGTRRGPDPSAVMSQLGEDLPAEGHDPRGARPRGGEPAGDRGPCWRRSTSWCGALLDTRHERDGIVEGRSAAGDTDTRGPAAGLLGLLQQIRHGEPSPSRPSWRRCWARSSLMIRSSTTASPHSSAGTAPTTRTARTTMPLRSRRRDHPPRSRGRRPQPDLRRLT